MEVYSMHRLLTIYEYDVFLLQVVHYCCSWIFQS